MISPASHFFSSQRQRLHYLDWGNAGAPMLILVHGGRDSCRTWDWAAAALVKDWHVIVPDLRGHGDSDWSGDGIYPMAGFVLDLANLIDHLGEKQGTIIGHSLGGNISLRFAASHPDLVRRLIVIEGMGPSVQTLKRLTLPPAEQLRGWIDDRKALEARTPRRYSSVEEAQARMMEGNLHLTPERAAHLTHHGVLRNADGTFSWKYDNHVRGFAPVDMVRPRDLWRSIACPVLLVHGADSWAVEQLSEENLSCFKDGRVAMIDGAGHWPHHDQEAAFLETVSAFL